ncbi:MULTISPECIES: hypothetical protein [unclassified Agromyces]|uniref:hypothetical protein n=1 Tax=unclassified Agromyces TaxID=2639701 RepID=UPI0030145536
MNAIFRKLNLTGDRPVHVIDAPASFEPELAEVAETNAVVRSLDGVAGATFAMAFATKQHEVDAFAEAVSRATEGDATVWVAYPKGSSKRYTCEFNRDTGWAALGAAGFEPVRQVAIDEDWSALRFRRVEYIAKLTRSAALSEQGRARLGDGGLTT